MICRFSDPYNQNVKSSLVQDLMKKHPTSENEVLQSTVCVRARVCVCVCARVSVCVGVGVCIHVMYVCASCFFLLVP